MGYGVQRQNEGERADIYLHIQSIYGSIRFLDVIIGVVKAEEPRFDS